MIDKKSPSSYLQTSFPNNLSNYDIFNSDGKFAVLSVSLSWVLCTWYNTTRWLCSNFLDNYPLLWIFIYIKSQTIHLKTIKDWGQRIWKMHHLCTITPSFHSLYNLIHKSLKSKVLRIKLLNRTSCV